MHSEIETLKLDNANIQRSLGRIEGKLDALGNNLVNHTKEDYYNFEALNKQIDTLQRLNWMALGIIAFLGISVPIAVAWIK